VSGKFSESNPPEERKLEVEVKLDLFGKVCEVCDDVECLLLYAREEDFGLSVLLVGAGAREKKTRLGGRDNGEFVRDPVGKKAVRFSHSNTDEKGKEDKKRFRDR
jgi:hypothetical protein